MRSPKTAVDCSHDEIHHGNAVWWFVGRNKARRALPGRPEHTDAVTHDGTWHFQLSGAKVWHLRATEALAASLGRPAGSPPLRVRVTVRPGQVLLVDTRQWWHHTELPCTLGAEEELSVSGRCGGWSGKQPGVPQPPKKLNVPSSARR